MTILVVGGAGYIGSHMVQMLAANKLDCVVLDNLSTGFADALTNIIGSVELVVGDLDDKSLLTQLFAQHEFTAVMHFAAFSQVGESIQLPQKYYSNNLVNTINLLEVMAAHQVKQLVFSSTAAVYGEPVQPVISELHPLAPINPYGRSKLAIEWVLQDYASAYGLKSVALRYFNAAGADPLGANGERHDPETHLIPLVLQAASGRRNGIKIFGSDYDTEDGTCIRDYVHIVDLCSAHLAALNWLQAYTGQGVYEAVNLGNGSGFSVAQVINTIKQITQKEFTVERVDRRQGDPAVLVASAKKAGSMLNWHPKYSQLKDIISHAWQWERQQCR